MSQSVIRYKRHRFPSAAIAHVNVFSAVRNLLVPTHLKKTPIDVHLHRLSAIAQWKGIAGIVA